MKKHALLEHKEEKTISASNIIEVMLQQNQKAVKNVKLLQSFSES